MISISSAAEAFIRLLYPENCVNCSQVLDLNRRFLCLRCQQKVRKTLFTPLESLLPQAGNQPAECTSSLFPYEAVIRDLIHEIKFSCNPGLLNHLLETAAPLTDAWFHEFHFDAVTAVPMHPFTKASASFNPAEEIALFLSRKYKVPCEMDLLRKKGGVPSQMSLGKQERLANLFGAFKMVPLRHLKNKTILLIDDVYTTGTTVNEAARIIKKTLHARVAVMTLARVRRPVADN